MNTITYTHGSGSPVRAIRTPAGASMLPFLRSAACMLAMALGAVALSAAVVALRFTLVGQAFVPQQFALGILIASALAGILAFWCATVLDATPATEAATR
jgi:hypothetical protein